MKSESTINPLSANVECTLHDICSGCSASYRRNHLKWRSCFWKRRLQNGTLHFINWFGQSSEISLES